ncbi:MAG: rRNA maturation RNase YbeY [Bacteriovoracaceae bacterium]|nr:rRNA maturation RNase YbeY [Bacteriovoracaceae bacterium]
MKKHPFLHVDYHSTVKMSPAETRQLDKWLHMAGDVLKYLLMKKGIIPAPKIKGLHVSLLICGDSRIRELNREYRQKDKVTDVLSFPAHEDLRKSGYQGEDLFLGDLAICHPQTKRQAKKFDIGYFDEFIHLFFHGTIHLMGFDHEISLKEEKLMEGWEQEALKKFSEIKKKAR